MKPKTGAATIPDPDPEIPISIPIPIPDFCLAVASSVKIPRNSFCLLYYAGFPYISPYSSPRDSLLCVCFQSLWLFKPQQQTRWKL